MMVEYLLGYGLSVVVAIPATFYWSRFLHSLAEKHRAEREERAERIPWIPFTVGIFERIIITTLVGWSIPGTAGFIGAWVALKSAGGWRAWSKGTTYGRAIFFVGLLGSAMSLLFAIVGGIIIAK